MNEHEIDDGVQPEDFREDWLSAYLDDELPQPQRTIVEQRLAADQAARATLNDLQQIRSLVGGLPNWTGTIAEVRLDAAVEPELDQVSTKLELTGSGTTVFDEDFDLQNSLDVDAGTEPSAGVASRVNAERTAWSMAGLRPISVAASLLLMIGIGWMLWPRQPRSELARLDDQPAPTNSAPRFSAPHNATSRDQAEVGDGALQPQRSAATANPETSEETSPSAPGAIITERESFSDAAVGLEPSAAMAPKAFNMENNQAPNKAALDNTLADNTAASGRSAMDNFRQSRLGFEPSSEPAADAAAPRGLSAGGMGGGLGFGGAYGGAGSDLEADTLVESTAPPQWGTAAARPVRVLRSAGWSDAAVQASLPRLAGLLGISPRDDLGRAEADEATELVAAPPLAIVSLSPETGVLASIEQQMSSGRYLLAGRFSVTDLEVGQREADAATSAASDIASSSSTDNTTTSGSLAEMAELFPPAPAPVPALGRGSGAGLRGLEREPAEDTRQAKPRSVEATVLFLSRAEAAELLDVLESERTAAQPLDSQVVWFSPTAASGESSADAAESERVVVLLQIETP